MMEDGSINEKEPWVVYGGKVTLYGPDDEEPLYHVVSMS
jgi:hypothetical protein